jgi:aldose 1-epimerase
MNLNQKPFGHLPDGTRVDLFTLTNNNGMQAVITNYGGIIVQLHTPDRNGKLSDICLGFDELDGYLGPHPYFGALIGRYANRIAGGRFELDGSTYQIAVNNGPNALHGGLRGFDKVLWDAMGAMTNFGVSLSLRYRSADCEEGFPGNLDVRVVYTLSDDNTLQLDYHATTDAPTVLNLTNHAYFNLNPGSETVYDHQVQVTASHYAVADEVLIPSGEFAPIAGTPFDFSQPTRIGARIHAPHPMLAAGRGYDVGFVVPGTSGAEPRLAASVYEPVSGRVLNVETSEPDCHLYTGGFLDGSIVGKAGRAYAQHSGFCLETQHFPDSPNNPQLPSTVLRPGEAFRSTTVFRFDTA